MLGPYEIISPIGAGGMGEVFEAKDTRLGRTVAIKVLPSHLSSDDERRGRFEREARAASALNHPNITTVYDIHLRQGYGGQVGEEEDPDYIVMEYVEGKTFRELVNDAPLSTEKMLPLATQVAEGLSKAHAAGIVHRDLKPENLMVTEDGLVKILDFGLAKLIPESSDVDSETATVTRATQQGVVMGTVQYMSPEQAANRPLDFRSDQFSFGSILYEMATGKRAFKKDTMPQTLAAIIEDNPEPLRKLNSEVPVELEAIVKRCLAKDPARRYESTGDLAKELKDAPENLSPWRVRRKFFWAAAGLLVAVLATALGPNLIRLWDQISSSTTAAPIESIAVLPLRNLSGDPEQQYFADGMTEALITDLAKIGALKVISRSSSMRYKGTDKPLAEIARELNVDVVVEGSAQRVGGSVRIMAQLIDPKTEQALWAESYERDLENVLILQSEVAQAIAEEVEVALTPEETARLAGARPVDPEAYEAYLKGQFHWHKIVPQDLETAMHYFELALEKDPYYAPAYAGIAAVWAGRTYMGLRTGEAMPEMRTAAIKCLELDSTLPEAHWISAVIATWYDWNWDGGETEFRRAIELDPNYADARVFYGLFLTAMGRHEEAKAQIERALELDPLSSMFQTYLGYAHFRARRFDEAVVQFRKGLSLEAHRADAHGGLWRALHEIGMYEQALAEAKEFLIARGYSDVAEAMTRGEAESGYAGAMIMGAKTLEARSNLADSMYIARLYLSGGEKERALEWLEKAYQERIQDMIYLRVSPMWDPLRSDTRFQDLVRRMSLPTTGSGSAPDVQR
jgi:serine/threonine-protein kinase